MKTRVLIIAWISFFAVGSTSNLWSQWIQTSGPNSGSILTLTASGKYLFAGTFFGAGIVRTSDSGTTWNNANNGLSGSIGATVVYAIVESGTKLFAGTGDGIFSSTNGGTNWKTVTSGLPSGTTVNAFAISGPNLFAGTSAGVILSTNNGINWKTVNNGLTNTSVGALAVSGTNIFAGTYGGVFLSNDMGSNWTKVNNGLSDTIIRAFAVIGNEIFAGTFGWPDTGGVYLTTNAGAMWTRVGNGLPPAEIHAFAVNGLNLFVGIDSGVYMTSNTGASWTAVNSGLTVSPSPYVSALGVAGTNLFASTDIVWRRALSDFGASDVPEHSQPDITISLSPNPTIGDITVHNPPTNTLHIIITNVLGETVRELSNSGAADFTLDLSTLPPGTYFARFEAQNEVITRKIVRE
ncbi:MAG: T9SS type A sorting domain-containing protein [Bacteroidota bacterium]|nr:T9SS type A sorting domain-containing protein [Bacteroidota bacterium]MDP4229071.1 T9SS type A sorting domain-containing protein [Bacteroidota bacterium]MDP4237232.1 T9SS type A sorting domain-containing protein [Bacteroidota bacterium]